MKNLKFIITTSIMGLLLFSCSNDKNIKEIISENLEQIGDWKTTDELPSFILKNKYMDTYYNELYENGGLANVAYINKITNKDLLLKIIGSCNPIIDSKPSLRVLRNINFGENRLFDFYYNYSTRQIATLHYKVLFGPKELSLRIRQINPNCKELKSDTVKIINSIKYAENEKLSQGFIIEMERTKSNHDLKVDKLELEKIASKILSKGPTKLTFKRIDVITNEMISSIIKLNPNDTFKINYTGPYIFEDMNGFNLIQETKSVKFSLKITKIY